MLENNIAAALSVAQNTHIHTHIHTHAHTRTKHPETSGTVTPANCRCIFGTFGDVIYVVCITWFTTCMHRMCTPKKHYKRRKTAYECTHVKGAAEQIVAERFSVLKLLE